MAEATRGDLALSVGLTRDLVRIPSENPTGNEAAMSGFVADWFSRLPGVNVQIVEVAPGRPNVIARLAGSTNQPPLALVAHMDTVPFGSGWKMSPTSGEIVDGLLYGRGSCDMKSGLAVAMATIAEAAHSGRVPKRGLVVCATVDEEGPLMQGVNKLVDVGILDKESLVIATEPSDLKAVVAHKGLVWIEVEAHGKLAHAGNPKVGVDAIRAIAEFITEIKREVDALGHEHPFLGCTEITFSGISGGIKTNVVPDYARLEIDVRLPPPLALRDIHSLVDRCCRRAEERVVGSRLAYKQFNNDRPPVEADTAGEFTKSLLDSIGDVTGKAGETAVFPAYTDASVVQARTGNRNCLVFGPGRLAQAHIVDEYVPVDQIEKAEAILIKLMQRVCY